MAFVINSSYVNVNANNADQWVCVARYVNYPVVGATTAQLIASFAEGSPILMVDEASIPDAWSLLTLAQPDPGFFPWLKDGVRFRYVVNHQVTNGQYGLIGFGLLPWAIDAFGEHWLLTTALERGIQTGTSSLLFISLAAGYTLIQI